MAGPACKSEIFREEMEWMRKLWKKEKTWGRKRQKKAW